MVYVDYGYMLIYQYDTEIRLTEPIYDKNIYFFKFKDLVEESGIFTRKLLINERLIDLQYL
jgi:hypothetical protein